MQTATIISPYHLDQKQIIEVEKQLLVIFGKKEKIKITNKKVDKKILGGFIVKIKDKVIDLSLQGYFDKTFVRPDFQPKIEETGKILKVADGVVIASGLSSIQYQEIVKFDQKTFGLAFNLEKNKVGIIVLGSYRHLRAGGKVSRSGEILQIGVSEDLLGRVVDPLGKPLDGKPPFKTNQSCPLEKIAPSVVYRKSVDTPLQTGIKAIDAIIPIGRGQRELIIGDRATGKSSIPLTTIINQKGKNVVCIYVAIGQKRSFIARTIATLKKFAAMEHTIFVAASASDPASLQYLAPYAGCAIGEYFAQKGQDALVIYDDLSKHAWAYREISLLLKRPSGREAYPGDIFYLHSRLLERACKYDPKYGGGSLTALPIIETQAGDLSAYIPTNVISITDGQIYLESDLFYAGTRPAVNIGLSVSRVGGAAQAKAMKKVAGKLRLEMAAYRELAAFAQFSSDLDAATKAQLDRGIRITEILKQGWEEPYSLTEQILVIWAITNNYFDKIKVEKIKEAEKAFLEFARKEKKGLLKTISKKGDLDEKIEKELKETLESFIKTLGEEFIEQKQESEKSGQEKSNTEKTELAKARHSELVSESS